MSKKLSQEVWADRDWEAPGRVDCCALARSRLRARRRPSASSVAMSSGQPSAAATARSRLELDRLPNPKGDRVRLVMSGKFLPHDHCGAEQGAPENGFKEE
jgi:hypothetical protein